MTMTATYSPEDNCLRLSASPGLDSATLSRVNAAGFVWEPNNERFLSRTWTPAGYDLLVELCGEIGDENIRLTKSARERAGCSEVARQTAEESWAGKVWETTGYWKARAAGATRTAKYKEPSAVSAKRIKGLAADERHWQRRAADSIKFTGHWLVEGLTLERAVEISNIDRIASGLCFPLADYPRMPPANQYAGAMFLWSALTGGIITAGQARDIAIAAHARSIDHAQRWLDHIANRLAYERAMLGESGGSVTDAVRVQTGGAHRIASG